MTDSTKGFGTLDLVQPLRPEERSQILASMSSEVDLNSVQRIQQEVAELQTTHSSSSQELSTKQLQAVKAFATEFAARYEARELRNLAGANSQVRIHQRRIRRTR